MVEITVDVIGGPYDGKCWRYAKEPTNYFQSDEHPDWYWLHRKEDGLYYVHEDLSLRKANEMIEARRHSGETTQ